MNSRTVASTFAAFLLFNGAFEAFADEHALTEPEKKEVFTGCNSEGLRALKIARFYSLSDHDVDELRLRTLGDTALEALVDDLVLAEENGESEHYAFFAANKLVRCFERNDLPLDKPLVDAARCYIQVDVPYSMFELKRQGLTKREARKTILKNMDDRQYFPRAMINKVADRVYTQGSEKIKDYIEGNIFWGCYYEEEWKES